MIHNNHTYDWVRDAIDQRNVLEQAFADLFKEAKIVGGKHTGLRKASSAMLGMFIKEIDVLTPAKLRAVRRVRSILGG